MCRDSRVDGAAVCADARAAIPMARLPRSAVRRSMVMPIPQAWTRSRRVSATATAGQEDMAAGPHPPLAPLRGNASELESDAEIELASGMVIDAQAVRLAVDILIDIFVREVHPF